MQNSTDSILKKIADFEHSCRKAGLKLTHQRLEIFRELLLSKDHPTAEILYGRLRTKLPTISLDTVYRTLNTLAEKGIINRVETVESLARFEAVHIRHHHLVCSECGQITDFTWPVIDETELPEDTRAWGRIDHKTISVYGICTTCLDQQKNRE